jgi:hypothetical protein
MSNTERDKLIRAKVNEIEEKFKNGEIKPPKGIGAVAVNIYTGEVYRIAPNSHEARKLLENMALQDGED